jgi:hypothetical protein
VEDEGDAGDACEEGDEGIGEACLNGDLGIGRESRDMHVMEVYIRVTTGDEAFLEYESPGHSRGGACHFLCGQVVKVR